MDDGRIAKLSASLLTAYSPVLYPGANASVITVNVKVSLLVSSDGHTIKTTVKVSKHLKEKYLKKNTAQSALGLKPKVTKEDRGRKAA